MTITEKKLLDGYRNQTGTGDKHSIVNGEHFFWEYRYNKIEILYTTAAWLETTIPGDFLASMNFPEIIDQTCLDENTIKGVTL